MTERTESTPERRAELRTRSIVMAVSRNDMVTARWLAGLDERSIQREAANYLAERAAIESATATQEVHRG